MTDTTDTFDPTTAEREQLDVLLDEGMTFRVPKQSVLRYFGKKERTFLLKPPFRGTQAAIDKVCLDIELDEEKLKQSPLLEARRLMNRYNYHTAKIVAIAYLRSEWRIKLLTPFLTHYFYWRMDSVKLQQIVRIMVSQAGLPNFIDSIRYLCLRERITAPALMEKPEDAQPD